MQLKVSMEKVIKQYLTKLTEQDILTIFCTFAAIGIIGLIYDLCLLIKRKIFAEKYLLRYEQWEPHRRFSDEESYEPLRRWLQRNSTKIDNEIGETKRIDFYNRSPSENQAVLERHIGELENLISQKVRGVFNPFIWLTRAVRWFFIDSILWIFRSVGLINVNRKNRIRNHSLSDKFAGTITLLGSLFSVIAGWDSVVKFFHQIFGWLGLSE